MFRKSATNFLNFKYIPNPLDEDTLGIGMTKSAGSEIKRRVHFIKLNMMSIVPLIWMLMFNLFLQIAGC